MDPIWIVRWPNLSVSLISAANEAELLDRLDELGNTSSCEWEMFDGPLAIDITLPAKVDVDRSGVPYGAEAPPDRYSLGDVDEPLLHGYLASAMNKGTIIWESDSGVEMANAIAEFAFPRLHMVVDDDDYDHPRYFDANHEPNELYHEEIRKALRKEMVRLLGKHPLVAPGVVGDVARRMDMDPRLTALIADDAEAAAGEEHDLPEPPTEEGS